MTLQSLAPGRHAAANGGELASDIPRPRSRWKTRLLVPVVILSSTTGLLVYSARSALTPLTEVRVIPVVTASRATAEPAESAGTVHEAGTDSTVIVAQAPGWIEPAPYPVLVPALAEGVVEELLVLEGERVEAGQVVARLIDADARLAVESAEALLASLHASVIKAEADVRAAEARSADIDDQLARTSKLVPTGIASESQLALLRFRLHATQEELAATQASLLAARANARVQEVACIEAKLKLSRMEITSPLAGVVLKRYVEPGSRVSTSGLSQSAGATEPMSSAVLRIYDPARLQARVDVPLADCAKVHVGTRAEIVTEALPDTVFLGVVSRIVHEANIQRNTVPMKVAIENPMEILKPEMLVRVRFHAQPAYTASSTPRPSALPENGTASASSTTVQGQEFFRLLIPSRVLLDRQGDAGRVWVVEHDPRDQTTVAAERKIRMEAASTAGLVSVIDGLRPGDRVIVNPPTSLMQGTRVRILGEAAEEELPVRREE